MYSPRKTLGTTGKREIREIGNSDQLCKFIPFGHNSIFNVLLLLLLMNGSLLLFSLHRRCSWRDPPQPPSGTAT
jgi:hypothetical protein